MSSEPGWEVFPDHLGVLFDGGFGPVGTPNNNLVPGFKPGNLEESIAEFY